MFFKNNKFRITIGKNEQNIKIDKKLSICCLKYPISYTCVDATMNIPGKRLLVKKLLINQKTPVSIFRKN
jgi:hypothetical protein